MDWSIFAPPPKPPKPSLQTRVFEAAEDALQVQHEVSPIEVFCRLQLLHQNHVSTWRSGRCGALDELMQGNPQKIADVFRHLHEFAQQHGLEPFTARYTRATRGGEEELRFTGAKFRGLEDAFHIH